MRELGLTSPMMRGHDVAELQRALLPFHDHVAVDGVYGPATAHAVAAAAFSLGLSHYTATKGVQHLILHTHLRNPEQLALAHQRRIHHEHLVVPITGGGKGPAAALAYARHFIGVHEQPVGSNWGEPEPAGWIKRMGFDFGVAWCGCFATACVEAGGGHLTTRASYVPNIIGDAHAGTGGFLLWHDNHQQAAPGDLVCYCWDGSGVGEHVGVVESIHPDHLVAIEGNTGGNDPSNGGMVWRCERSYQFSLGYARPRY